MFGEQLGPARASRAMAIVHIAMFDSVNGIAGGFRSYTNVRPAPTGASMTTAIAQAARDTLTALFPSQQSTFDQFLASDLNQVRDGRAKTDGIDMGHRAAFAILSLRSNDGSQLPEPRLGVQFFPSDQPGKWRQDPISQSPIALGAYWGTVRPFVMRSARQFRTPTPPSLTSAEYTTAYNQVKLIGGDGIVTPTVPTGENKPKLEFTGPTTAHRVCARHRAYTIRSRCVSPMEWEQLPMLPNSRGCSPSVNTSMADAAIAIWESKYFYQYSRAHCTGIRESDPGTGPNRLWRWKSRDHWRCRTFSPLGAPASNLTGPNFTPPFPSYPSGHAGFGGALFQTLRAFYRTDNIAFTFTSDEFNGTTRDNAGNVRPLLPRSFSSLSQAEKENGGAEFTSAFIRSR